MIFSALLLTAILPINLLFNFSSWYTKPTPPPTPTIRPRATPTPITYSLSSPTLKPTPTSTPKPIISPSPSPSISPFPTPSPSLTSTPNEAPSNSDSQTDYFINQINDYRRSQGLAPIKADPHTCSFAAIRAQEISSSFNHDGFRNRLDSKSLPYPSYSFVTENIARNSNYQNVVNQWIASSGHAANLRADTPYGCVKSVGNYFAYEGWKPQ